MTVNDNHIFFDSWFYIDAIGNFPKNLFHSDHLSFFQHTFEIIKRKKLRAVAVTLLIRQKQLK